MHAPQADAHVGPVSAATLCDETSTRGQVRAVAVGSAEAPAAYSPVTLRAPAEQFDLTRQDARSRR